MDNDTLADSIAEELLLLTGDALLSRDFPAFRTHFKLPIRLETVEGERVLETDEQFLEVFDAVLAHMEETGVNDFVRTVIHAEFLDPKTIRYVHICTEIHNSTELRRPTYPVYSTIVNDGGKWRITSCLYVILDNAKHNRALVKT